jgi:hypothetical protein
VHRTIRITVTFALGLLATVACGQEEYSTYADAFKATSRFYFAKQYRSAEHAGLAGLKLATRDQERSALCNILALI